MKTVINQLRQAGEVYAAALLENPERSPLWRSSRATAEFFKIATLPRYDGGRLYPCGHSFSISSPQAVKPEFSYTWLLDARDPRFLAACEACPKHGNDDPAVNRIAEAVSARISGRFETHTCTPGGRYFPVSNQFATYEDAGHAVRATPDGRAAGEPLCDSCGAIRGRDVSGPTAMLNSVASLRLSKALGTPITNLRMKKESLPTLLKPLVQGFFRQGGVQLQITCASRAELLDAVAHPEKHENLVVRIGGYSEYFNRLSPVLKQTVIERTEY